MAGLGLEELGFLLKAQGLVLKERWPGGKTRFLRSQVPFWGEATICCFQARLQVDAGVVGAGD